MNKKPDFKEQIKHLEKNWELKKRYISEKIKEANKTNFDNEDIWKDLDSDSSRFIQQLSSTMMLNGCALLVYGLFMPWFNIGVISLSAFEAAALNQFSIWGLSITLFAGGVSILFFILRSLITKKFNWFFYSIFAVLNLLNIVFFYYIVMRLLKDAIKNRLITTGPGVWISIVASLVIILSGLITYLTRNKEEEKIKKLINKRKTRRRRKI